MVALVETTPKQDKMVHMLTLQCREKDCLAKLRIGRFLYLPSTRVGAMKFCPICGGEAFALTDNDESYMETLADSYGIPVEVFKQVYAIWDSGEYPKLYDFVQEIKKDAGIVTDGTNK